MPVSFKKVVKRTLFAIAIATILSGIALVYANYVIGLKGEDTYNTVSAIPKNNVGLLLGTSKYLINGHQNLYYKYRIDAAVQLYRAGKVNYILISGDNSTKNYNEPAMMKEDLVQRGIPENKLFLDYAGFRTLDAVVRSKAVFGQDSVTVISQQFHNERAMYLAEHKDIYAVGFNAKSVSARYGFKTALREKFARVKVLIDLVLGVKPKFYGDSIEIKG